jgi:hypothetical protein
MRLTASNAKSITPRVAVAAASRRNCGGAAFFAMSI